MIQVEPILRRSLVVAALASLGSSGALAGCGKDCLALTHECGYLHLNIFCRDQPEACTVGGRAFFDIDQASALPSNETVRIDLSGEALGADVLDLDVTVHEAFETAPEDFEIRLDGVDAIYSKKTYMYGFPGHDGPPRILEVTWNGDAGPEVRVSMILEHAACVAKVSELPVCEPGDI